MLTLTFSQGLPGEDGDGVVVGGREEERRRRTDSWMDTSCVCVLRDSRRREGGRDSELRLTIRSLLRLYI